MRTKRFHTKLDVIKRDTLSFPIRYERKKLLKGKKNKNMLAVDFFMSFFLANGKKNIFWQQNKNAENKSYEAQHRKKANCEKIIIVEKLRKYFIKFYSFVVKQIRINAKLFTFPSFSFVFNLTLKNNEQW